MLHRLRRRRRSTSATVVEDFCISINAWVPPHEIDGAILLNKPLNCHLSKSFEDQVCGYAQYLTSSLLIWQTVA